MTGISKPNLKFNSCQLREPHENRITRFQWKLAILWSSKYWISVIMKFLGQYHKFLGIWKISKICSHVVISYPGSLPMEFENLTGIVGLPKSSNSLSGHLPTNISISVSLKFLHALFDRPIPMSVKTCISQHFGVYPHLEPISLVSNRLSGHISPNWGECHQLEVLHIARKTRSIIGQIQSTSSRWAAGRCEEASSNWRVKW